MNQKGFARIPTFFIVLTALAASGGAYYVVKQSQSVISNNTLTEETTNSQSTSTVTNGEESVVGQECQDIVNATFSSVEEHGCGMVPTGSPPVKCHYELKFFSKSYEWGHDDMVEQGPYTCKDGVINATSHNPERAIPARYNPDTKILKWGDEEYRRL